MVEGVLSQWMGISESDVVLMWRSFRTDFVEDFHQTLSLDVRPFLYGGTPSNFLVMFPEDGCSSPSNQGTKLAARMQSNNAQDKNSSPGCELKQIHKSSGALFLPAGRAQNLLSPIKNSALIGVFSIVTSSNSKEKNLTAQ